MKNKNAAKKKRLPRKTETSQLKAQDIAYLTCQNGHVNKYSLKSRDTVEAFKCPECEKKVLYDPISTVNAMIAE